MSQESEPTHTYGPTCHLAKPITSGSTRDDDVPEMHARFFYNSLYHIDDPLSAAPNSTASESKSVKHTPRPFSALDNNYLEAAWYGLGSEKDRKNHNKGKARKASRPLQSGRLGYIVGTLTSKAEHKKASAKESAAPDTQAPGSSAKQPNSRAAKKLSHFSADASSEHPSSQPVCSCDGGHDNCKSKPSQCDCGSCPKIDAKGNPYNPRCDDPRHVPVDFEDRGCCSDYEGRKSQPEHTENKSHEGTDAKQISGQCELGDCQGDGANELVNKVSRSFKERRSAQSPSTEPTCNLSSKEHAELERHENSKKHQSFAKHLQAKHPDADKLEPTVRKQKVSEKGTTPANPSDSTNRPDQVNDAGTTGRPFIKLPSRPTTPQPPSTNVIPQKEEKLVLAVENSTDIPKGGRSRDERDSTETEEVSDHKCKAHKNTKEVVDVLVGVSKLHKVRLPALQMEPIYWSPVNDVASVTRGTWFYRDTMLPVEPAIANQLESGYRGMRPWSQTWKDEVRSAMEVGAAGEEKVAHRLWPKDENKSNTSEDILSIDPYCAARCFRGEAAAEGIVDPDDLDKKPTDAKTIVKRYPNSQVIYKDSRNAFILKPNLQPSAYHKRRPIYKINKGLTIGIHVCRGFDRKAWDKLHPSKKVTSTTKETKEVKDVDEHAAISRDSDFGRGDPCPACRSQEQPRECTDLCLVIHGIGQKLSERMESFHFTHAINAFRRAVNVEYCNDGVQKVCRKDLGGVMVLPVNWRSNLSFENDDPSKDGESSGSSFSLKDITQPTIPAIRSMISDVMLDVPYYMSNNKDKMVQAVISEANRVYRLWCKNNPNFGRNGRVHLIAHSLGSVMAMEILSNQPTLVPKIDPIGKKGSSKHLDFNTANLFCCGSPAGFFLLLEKKKLLPRQCQNKPGAEVRDDKDKSIVGEQGTFGCLAVNNIYNVMHTNDPIAYRLNACADATYAASLKEGRVPSVTTGFFESIGNAMKVLTPGAPAPTDLAIGQMPKPTLTNRMPSQLEMEIHNFSAEEKAEKKFCLLNDNGQIDYCLSSGGGPLEIQYLNMLSAHSSYWTSPDFVRMLCTEVGRDPGKANCLPNMKAVKIKHKP